ncbi:unnamed protein product [Echinostoma caproni]|uniref:Reverse transcriptase domain-containing protein n=1 Tax=Echinostoma caproni TaxID=27848 RepID=A0A183ALE4_9TREM|nr:unnamed protein product [Echinostoma caproni]
MLNYAIDITYKEGESPGHCGLEEFLHGYFHGDPGKTRDHGHHANGSLTDGNKAAANTLAEYYSAVFGPEHISWTDGGGCPAVDSIPSRFLELVSPCYDLELLDRDVPIRIAMPFRKIVPVSLLTSHLRSLRDRKPLDSVRNSSGLPSHWSLGVPRSFHARLSTTTSVEPGTYSWLCEPGVMGGGLINLYGAGLIDVAFILTGGLKLTSVNCVSRVFDWKLTDDPNCIRRMSAEDYVVITGELEPSESGTCFGMGSPVAVFCISSELPPVDFGGADSTEDFRLNIELTGSSGRFVIHDQGNQISWTPVKPLSSRTQTSKMWKRVSAVSENEERPIEDNSINGLHSSDSKSSSQKPLTNGALHRKLSEISYDSPSVHNVPVISATTVAHNTETVTFSTKNLNVDAGSKVDSNSNIHPLRLAWSHWLNHLTGCVQPNRTKLNMDMLLATPEHWAYVQRVLTALEKSSRQRCWIDVATGERL